MSDMPMNHSINPFDACFTAKSLGVYSVGLQIDDEVEIARFSYIFHRSNQS